MKDLVLKHKVLVITVGVLVLFALVGGFTGYYVTHRNKVAADDYHTAVLAYQKEKKAFDSYLASKEVKDAKGITKEQVTDPKTIDKLARDMASPDKAQVTLNVGKASVSRYRELTSQLQTAIKGYTTGITTVKHDVSAVNLFKAHKELDTTVDSADQLLKDTDGRVADNAVRDNLSKDIEEARKILGDKKAVLKSFVDEKSKLESLMNAVNDSTKVKADADAKAAADAAAAQAQVQSQANAGSGSANRGYSGGSSYRRGGSGYSYNRGGGGSTNRGGGSGGGSGYNPFDGIPHGITGGDHEDHGGDLGPIHFGS